MTDEVVQAQLDAYNTKDIEALLATYSPKAEQYATGGELLAQGHEQVRPCFLARSMAAFCGPRSPQVRKSCLPTRPMQARPKSPHAHRQRARQPA
jgi:hypothetical protein